jgi:peroxin-11B
MGRLTFVNSARTATRQQLVVDLCDVWIPATGSGIVNVNDGALGILGYVFAVLSEFINSK